MRPIVLIRNALFVGASAPHTARLVTPLYPYKSQRILQRSCDIGPLRFGVTVRGVELQVNEPDYPITQGSGA